MTKYDTDELRCDGCHKFKSIEETNLGFQFPPFYTGSIRLCLDCEPALLKFMINLHAEKEGEE